MTPLSPVYTDFPTERRTIDRRDPSDPKKPQKAAATYIIGDELSYTSVSVRSTFIGQYKTRWNDGSVV